MSIPNTSNDYDYALDVRAVRRAFDVASSTFDSASAVHAEIRNRLTERLDVIRIEPACVLDLGAGTGHSTRELKRRYRSALVIAADLSLGMLKIARGRSGFLHRFTRIAADAQQLPLRAATVDLVFSNLMLQWLAQPDAAIAEARRVLKTGGLFMFSTLGPDSLRELRNAWAAANDGQHVHTFFDMHDIGDALMRTGFQQPVMETERLTVTYRDWPALAAELRHSGSMNVSAGRSRGLTGRAASERALQSLETMRKADLIPITLEVVYGHAWAAQQQKRTNNEIGIAVDAISGRRGR
jgi:malonyl-CoA O-methyltransferase